MAETPLNNFIVRAQRRHVEKFLDTAAWDHLDEEDRHELVEHAAGLLTSVSDPNVDAKRFDLLCLRIQLAMLRSATLAPLRKAFIAHVHQLEAKGAMPAVARQLALILKVQTDE